MRIVAMLCLLVTAGFAGSAAASDEPLAGPARAYVLVFVRTDCPVTNRYAPELRRLEAEFKDQGVRFWMVYPDPSETPSAIEHHMAQYQFPGKPFRDPHHEWVKRSQATVAPEAAVFDASRGLAYIGRIDDRFVEFGKVRPAPRTHDLEQAIHAVLAGKAVTPFHTRAIGCFLADVQ